MPYTWSDTAPTSPKQELRLWPHQSLPPKGFAAFILITYLLFTVPLYGLLGTKLLWGLLPFLMITLAGVYYALRRNDRDRQILEVLTITPDNVHLLHRSAKGDKKEWDCNTYWARVALYPKEGPVPNYITLSGSGREVEIGSFLTEEERLTLYAELNDRLRQATRQ